MGLLVHYRDPENKQKLQLSWKCWSGYQKAETLFTIPAFLGGGTDFSGVPKSKGSHNFSIFIFDIVNLK